MDFRSDHWSLYVSGLPYLSLVHGLLLIRHRLYSPEVVESDLADFFGDLEDIYTREMFCRFALASGGGYGPHLTCHVAATARDRVGAPGVAGAHALSLPHGRNPVHILLY